MRRSKRTFAAAAAAAAALAIGGMSFSIQAFAAQAQANPNNAADPQQQQQQRERTADSSDTAIRERGRTVHAQGDVKGVQDLFARATDAAISENGLSQLQSMVVNENQIGSGATEGVGAPSTSGGASGRIGAGGGNGGISAGTGASGSSGASGTVGASGRDSITSGAAAGESARGSSREGRGREAGQGGIGRNYDSKQLDQTINQIRQQWKQKYNQDFRITNETVVFADITAADIGMGEAREAGSELRGSHSGSRDQDQINTGRSDRFQSGRSGSGGDSSGAAGAGAASDRSGARGSSSGSSGTGTSGETASSGRTNGELNGVARGAAAMEHRRPMTVNVPAVRGTQAVQVRVVREAGNQFQFASMTPVDREQLGQNLERHLRMVAANQNDWPQDVNHAYRLVTQHVLMAIADTTGANGAGQAMPAGSEIHGRHGAAGSGRDSGLNSGSGAGTTGNSAADGRQTDRSSGRTETSGSSR